MIWEGLIKTIRHSLLLWQQKCGHEIGVTLEMKDYIAISSQA